MMSRTLELGSGFIGIDNNVEEARSGKVKKRFRERVVRMHLLPVVSSTAVLNLESVTSKRQYKGP
jgi:hypothetical protein